MFTYLDRPTEKPRHSTDGGSSPRCGKIFLNLESAFSADSLTVSVHPSVRWHAVSDLVFYAQSIVTVISGRSVACINICGHSEGPQHWYYYHLDT